MARFMKSSLRQSPAIGIPEFGRKQVLEGNLNDDLGTLHPDRGLLASFTGYIKNLIGCEPLIQKNSCSHQFFHTILQGL